MLDSFLKILAAGLSLWDDKEKTKYQDKFISLKEAYHAEINKPPAARSDAVLDNIAWELCVLGDSFGSRISATNPTPKS